MEEVDQWDDEEQLLVIDEDNIKRVTVTDPFAPEMVAVPPEGTEVPAQGSTTPRPVATPDPGSQTPERVSTSEDETEHSGVPSGFSIEAIKATLDSILAASGNMSPPDISSQDLWNFDLRTPLDGSITAPNSMLAPIFSTLSEQERSKIATDLIINCIKQQRVLWDSTHQNFSDSKLCPLLWRNIASVVGYDVKKLKSKWYALKNTFKKEYIKSTSTGVTSKSPNFAAMSFLEGEIQRELQRANNEKNNAVQHLLKRYGGIEPQGVNDIDDSGEDSTDPNDDCMIVESEQVSAENSSRLKPKDTDASSRATAPSSSSCSSTEFQLRIRNLLKTTTQVKKGIRPRNISELQNGPQGSTSVSENRRSPKVICLGEPKGPQKIKQQYIPVPGQPIIKYNPTNKELARQSEVRIEVEDVMPKDWKEMDTNPESEAPPVRVKQMARKSICRANLTLFSKQNGAEHSVSNLNSSIKTYSVLSRKNQNSRSTEALQTSMTGTETAIQKPCRRSMESAKSESSKEFPDGSKRTPTVTKPPKQDPLEDDEIQIIKEVPRPSVIRSSTCQKQSESSLRTTSQDQTAPLTKRLSTEGETRSDPSATPKELQGSLKAEPSPDQPPKKPRISIEAESGPSSQVAQKRKVDKDRENSANEHFLLSLLYDVETMTNAQFRRFKQRSTALVSMIFNDPPRW